MITILRQKYETLVDTADMALNESSPIDEYGLIGIVGLHVDDYDSLKKQIQEIRTIQKSLRLEDRT